MSNATTTKSGRKPLSTKPATGSNLTYDELFGNNLTISPELKAELDSKGLIPRWVDARVIKEFNGYHPKGWRIYRREKQSGDTMDSMEFTYGNDPTGVIRRGSVVLAVKRKDEAELHRKFLDQRAHSYRNYNAEKAEELRQYAKQNRLKTTVLEGYEDESGDE